MKTTYTIYLRDKKTEEEFVLTLQATNMKQVRERLRLMKVAWKYRVNAIRSKE